MKNLTYITLSPDKSLVITKSTPIYRGDNMNTAITFLLPMRLDNVDLNTATVFLSYIRADGEPDMVILQQSGSYNTQFYSYVLPVTCKLSRYPGQVCMWLQIVDGNTYKPLVSKSGECIITIHASKSLDEYACDHQLTALYQLKKKYDDISEDNDWADMGDSDDGSWEEMDKNESDTNYEVWEDM